MSKYLLAVVIGCATAAAPSGVVAAESYKDMLAKYNAGDKAAAYDVGLAYYHGMSGAPHDYKKALEWFGIACNAGRHYACINAGDIYAYGKGVKANNTLAYSWYKKATGKDNPEAWEKLGDLYYNGRGVKRNRVEAAKCYQKAAENSDYPTASAKLGSMYLTGAGIKKDYGNAMKYFMKADELGDAGVSVKIATMHSSGLGVKRSSSKAAEWLLKGANAGDVVAMQHLANAYADGDGIHRSYAEAYKWLSVVTAKTNDKEAEKLLRKVTNRLSRTELASAKRQASSMIAKYVTKEDRESKAFLSTLKGN